MTAIRVLVAEDEAIFRGALVDLIGGDPSLELAGSAEDADEAIEVAYREKPDVALVDVRMPGGGGPRATSEICNLVADIKVLALSALDDRDAVLGMLRAGAVGYLLKDVSPDVLSQAINDAAKGQAILSRKVTADVIKELAAHLNRSEEFAKELQALDRTKSELVQLLSHELRTPASVIQGVVKTLTKPGLDLSPADIADISKSALRATAKLARIAGNVSVAAGLGAHDNPIPTREISVGELLSKMSDEFRHHESSLVLPARSQGASASVSADLDLATRALVLVMENALEMSPENQAVEVEVMAGPREVEIHVSDRGPGIPEELREKVFGPFVQVDASTTRTHQGLGIGLFLARRIMRAHGGKIEVLPRDGGGTTVVLTFHTYAPSSRLEEE